VATELGAEPGAVYTGESATRDELLKLDLTKFRYVLFATHAVLPGTIRQLDQPALVLAHPERNGYLTMSDVYGLSLQSDLVVLSACQSGGGTENSGEGVQGLTQAFMYAGAPAVAVTDWTVLDDVQKTFIPSFFHALSGASPAPPASALQSAKIQMIRGSNPALTHPFFWAGTVLFGDGAFRT
jgi:CHAT domain-containing protein